MVIGYTTNLAALRVHLVDDLDRVQVVHTRIETDLVHDHDPRLLDLVLELADAGRDVARRDDVRLALDRGLYDVDVVDVGHERDDEVVLRDLLLERGPLLRVLRARVKRERCSVAKVTRERLSALECAAS